MEKLQISSNLVEYEISSKENQFTITLNSEKNSYSVFVCGDEYLLFNAEKNKFQALDVYKDKNKVFLWVEDEELLIEEEQEDISAENVELSENIIKSPMPGIIKEIKFKEGDVVKKGNTILVLESMKVLNELKSSVNGVIKKIHVSINDQVGPLELLVEIDGGE